MPAMPSIQPLPAYLLGKVVNSLTQVTVATRQATRLVFVWSLGLNIYMQATRIQPLVSLHVYVLCRLPEHCYTIPLNLSFFSHGGTFFFN